MNSVKQTTRPVLPTPASGQDNLNRAFDFLREIADRARASDGKATTAPAGADKPTSRAGGSTDATAA